MKIKYDADADILMVVLSDMAPIDSIEEPGGIIVCYDEKKEPVSVEFLNASLKKLVKKEGISITLETQPALV
jgi:uncharacterized protein YuzE